MIQTDLYKYTIIHRELIERFFVRIVDKYLLFKYFHIGSFKNVNSFNTCGIAVYLV